MKLPGTYYQQINEAITQRKMPLDLFSLTKKRGWIYINYIPDNSYFSFFRKKSVTISEANHQWENQEIFKIKPSDGNHQQKENWQEVMASLSDWLKEISV